MFQSMPTSSFLMLALHVTAAVAVSGSLTPPFFLGSSKFYGSGYRVRLSVVAEDVVPTSITLYRVCVWRPH